MPSPGQRARIAVKVEAAVMIDRETVDRERGAFEARPQRGLALERVAGRGSANRRLSSDGLPGLTRTHPAGRSA